MRLPAMGRAFAQKKARRLLRSRRKDNARLIDAMAQHYGVRPCDLVGMDGASAMERLAFDKRCFDVWLSAQPKQQKKGQLVGDG